MFRVRHFSNGKVLTLVNDVPLDTAEAFFEKTEKTLFLKEAVVMDRLSYDLLEGDPNHRIIKGAETIRYAAYKKPASIPKVKKPPVEVTTTIAVPIVPVTTPAQAKNIAKVAKKAPKTRRK
jgi:hypothetical protein